MKLFPLPHIVVFLFSMFLGRFWGMQYTVENAVEQHQAPRQSERRLVVDRIPDDQVNFLIIKVDSLGEEQPQLQNLWWVLHKQQGSINMVSIYPSLVEDRQAEAILRSQFGIYKDGETYRLSQSFEELLRSDEIGWQAYLLLDDFAFRQILGDPSLIAHRSSAPLPFPGAASQLLQWKSFCQQNLQSAWQAPSYNPWIKVMEPQHVSFGPSPAIGKQVWQQLLSNTPTRTCAFPGLDDPFHD